MFFEFSVQDIVTVAAICGCLFALGAWLFRKDEQIEDRRKIAADISQELTKLGLDLAAEALRDYSVGDYSGVVENGKAIAKRLKDPAQRKLILDTMWEHMLETKLKSPEDLGKLKAVVEAALTTATPVVKAAVAAAVPAAAPVVAAVP